MHSTKIFDKTILKKLYSNGLLHIFTGSFATKLISFFGSIFVVRVLSKHDYGLLSYLENIYGYAFTMAGMGMSNAILRYVVLGKNIQEKYDYFSYACKKGLSWNCLLFFVAAIACTIYPHPKVYADSTWLLYILLFSLPFQYITDNVLCNERAMFSNQRYAGFSLILSCSIIISKVLSGMAGGVIAIVLCQASVYLVLALLFANISKRSYYGSLTARTLPISMRKEINLYSLQYMITNGLWAIFMLNDTFLLGRYSSPEVIADYKVAYTIPGCVSLISTALGIFVAPYFVKNETNSNWIRCNFKRVYIATAILVGGICIFIGLFAKPIVSLLYGNNYLNILPVMRILLMASFLNCGLRYTVANILAAMGKVKYNMLISSIGMVLQIGINVKVIPEFGSIGVAISSCIVYCFMACCLLAIFIKHYYFKK